MSENTDVVTEYFSFILISLIGLAINNAVLWVVHGKFKYNFYLSKLAAIVIVTIWNFFGNYMFTFT